MKRISILLLILLICLVMAAWPQAQPQWWQQKIITFDAPGAGTGAGQGTQPNAVNSAGVVTGWYLDDNNVWYGFLRTPDGKIITFSAPGAGTGTYQGSGGWGITPAGDITGDYVDVNCVEHGFIRKPHGEFIEFEARGRAQLPAPAQTGFGAARKGQHPEI
jgi:hypothetical protein